MPLLTWTNTDRLTHPDYIDKEWPRLSDYTQLLDGLKAIEDWWNESHSATHGRHNSYPSHANWEGYGADTASSFSTSAAIGGCVISTGAYGLMNPGLYRGHTASSGIVELFDVFPGRLIGGYFGPFQGSMRKRIGTRRLTATGGSLTLNFQSYINPPVDVGNLKISSPEWTYPTFGRPSFATDTRLYRANLSSLSAAGGAFEKAIYRQIWQLAYYLELAMKTEHDVTTMASEPPSFWRMAGRTFGTPFSILRSEITSPLGPRRLAAHGGNFMYAHFVALFPNESGSSTTPVGTCQYAILPAFDDQYVYADVQSLGSGAGSLYDNDQMCVLTSLFRDSSSDVGSLPTLDTTNYAAQEKALLPTHWQKLLDGFTRYYHLFRVEHEFASGCHMYPLNALPGATMIYNSAITVPSTVANCTYTLSDADSGGFNSDSATNISTIPLGGQPAGGGLYFFSLIGATGSGICTASIAVEDAQAYLIVRRKTTGTTNVFNARVWRIDP